MKIDNKTKMGFCRNCNKLIDAHTSVGDIKVKLTPARNDLSVCLYCGTLSKFDKDLNLTPLTPEELVEINDNDPSTFDLLIMTRTVILNNPIIPKP